MFKSLLLCIVAISTATSLFAAPLAGTYTIGGTSPDYATINAAITALDSNGISAPVVFNIRNGSYPELLIFSAVAGASATNTITFQGESGDSSLVEINGATTTNQQNTLRLNQINYLTIKHLTFRQYPNVYNNAVVFINRGKFCTIENCELFGHFSSNSSATEYVVQGCNDSNLVIRNSYLRGAVSGCYFGNSFFSHRNLLVENCNVATSLFIDAGALAIIRGNTILARVLLQATSRATINNNYIQNTLQCISSNGWPLQKMKIYNNVIIGGSAQGAVAYGFRASSSGDYDFYNNTIYMNTPTMSGYCIYTETSSSGITIKNNIFYRADTLSTNYIFRYPNAEAYIGNIISDNNLFFRNGTSFSDNYTNLAAFTTGTGLDSNSVYADPAFVSPNNLAPSSYAPTAVIANTIGVPVSYVTHDFNGNARSTLHPTIGAFEMPSAPYAISPFQNITVCQSSDTILISNFTGTSPISYQWYKNSTVLASDTIMNKQLLQIQHADSGTYMCVASNNLGSDTMYFHVHVLSPPTPPTISAMGSTTFCSGNSVMLMGNNGGFWNNGSTAADTLVMSTGLYFVTTTNSCGVGVSNTIAVSVTYVDTSVVVGNASFLANASNATYQWLLCDSGYSVVNGAIGHTYTPSLFFGFYAVEVTQNGCVDTSSCYAMIVTGSPSNLHKMEAFVLYPNPAKDILNISISSSLKGTTLVIQNTLGEVIYSKSIPIAIGSNALESIDVSGFTKGVYFINIENKVFKFVKE